jgi:hypothetical protein
MHKLIRETIEDFETHNYKSHEAVKIKMVA